MGDIFHQQNISSCVVVNDDADNNESVVTTDTQLCVCVLCVCKAELILSHLSGVHSILIPIKPCCNISSLQTETTPPDDTLLHDSDTDPEMVLHSPDCVVLKTISILVNGSTSGVQLVVCDDMGVDVTPWPGYTPCQLCLSLILDLLLHLKTFHNQSIHVDPCCNVIHDDECDSSSQHGPDCVFIRSLNSVIGVILCNVDLVTALSSPDLMMVDGTHPTDLGDDVVTVVTGDEIVLNSVATDTDMNPSIIEPDPSNKHLHDSNGGGRGGVERRRTDDGIICPVCQKYLKLKRSLRKHLKTHSQSSTVPSISDLDHVTEFLTDDNTCIFCHRTYKLKKSLRRHLLTHIEANIPLDHQIDSLSGKEQACPDVILNHDGQEGETMECGDTSEPNQDKSTSFDHNSYTKDTDYSQDGKDHECKVCSVKFSSKTLLTCHVRSDHMSGQLFQCPTCTCSFNTLMKLVEHTSVHSPVAEPCPHCGKIIYSRFSLQTHIRGHWYKRCRDCDLMFATTDELRDHVTAVHNDVKHYCETCSKHFPTALLLKMHKRTHRYINYRFICQFCTQTFHRKKGLIIHQRIHTMERPYVCEYCGKAFRAHHQLNRHTNIHTGKRPYKCDYCSLAYTRKDHLNSHIRRKHCGDRDEECGTCGLRYADRNDLRKHMKNIHSVKLERLKETLPVFIDTSKDPASSDGEHLKYVVL